MISRALLISAGIGAAAGFTAARLGRGSHRSDIPTIVPDPSPGKLGYFTGPFVLDFDPRSPEGILESLAIAHLARLADAAGRVA